MKPAGTADTEVGDWGFKAGSNYAYTIQITDNDIELSAGDFGRSVVAFISGRGTKDDLLAGSIIFAPTETTADLVREVKDNSGLTWEELGRIFGVSRRAVHNWANGGKANAFNSRRIRRVHALIHDLSRGNEINTREALLRHREPESSLYLALVSEVSPGNAVEGFRPGDLLSLDEQSE